MTALAVLSVVVTLGNLGFRVWAWRRAEARHREVLGAVRSLSKYSTSKYSSF